MPNAGFRSHLPMAVALAIVATMPCRAQAQSRDADASSAPTRSSDGSHLVLGLGASYAPARQGGGGYRVLPIPAIDVKMGPYFANFQNGIGMTLLDAGTLSAGVSATYTPGYRHRDVPRGIDDLPFGAGARAFVSMHAAGAALTIGGTKGLVGGNKGLVADASLAYPIVAAPRLMVIPTVSATWGDRRYNDRYFGISGREAALSGLRAFRADAGMKDASLSAALMYSLTRRLILGGSVGLTTLLGSAKDSPMVRHRTQPTSFLSLSYRIGG